MENLFQSPYYSGENTYKYDLRDHVQKAYGDRYDNHISPLQRHRLHLLQSARYS
jgi:hypothetical protein